MIQHCMDYCFHVWAGAHNFNLDILSKLQEQEDKVIAPTIASSLESLVDCWDVVGISHFSDINSLPLIGVRYYVILLLRS